MQIDLRECDTVIINMPGDDERRANMVELCERLGLNYRFITAIKCTPGRIGATLSHARAYRSARPGVPLFVLEDDLAATEDFNPIVTVPDDADAFYPGTSRYGALETIDFIGGLDMIAAEEVGDGLLRIHNMLAAHAVLYLTDTYLKAAERETIAAMLDGDWQADRALAKIQGDFKIYAQATPTLYQSAALQPGEYGDAVEDGTKVPVLVYPVGSIVSLILYGEWQKLWLVRLGDRLTWIPFDDLHERAALAAAAAEDADD